MTATDVTVGTEAQRFVGAGFRGELAREYVVEIRECFVSWTVATGRFAVASSPFVIAPHTWQATVNAATTGLETIPIAAKTIAATAIELFKSPAAIEAAKKDLAAATKGHAYRLLTPPDRKPPAYREGAAGQPLQ